MFYKTNPLDGGLDIILQNARIGQQPLVSSEGLIQNDHKPTFQWQVHPILLNIQYIYHIVCVTYTRWTLWSMP